MQRLARCRAAFFAVPARRRAPRGLRCLLPAAAPLARRLRLFMALSDAHAGQDWCQWPAALAQRDPDGAGQRTHAACTTQWPSGSSASGASSGSGSAEGLCQRRAASTSSATCRSSWPTTAPTSGRIARCSSCARMASRRWSPACRPTSSAPPASAGATRCTTGREHAKDDYDWWIRTHCAPFCTGRHRAHRSLPRLCRLLGDPGQRTHGHQGALAPRAGRGAVQGDRPGAGRRCRSLPKTWA